MLQNDDSSLYCSVGGTQKKPVNVILDTGSSTLAIDGTVYDATKDATATNCDPSTIPQSPASRRFRNRA